MVLLTSQFCIPKIQKFTNSPWVPRYIQLKAHKMMCDACSRYEKQSIFLDRAIDSFNEPGQGKDIESAKAEIEDLKKRINDKLARIDGSDN